MVTNKVLAKVAVIGGFVAISSGFYVNRKVQERIRSSDYYREAMKITRQHRGAISLLGEPIKAGNVDLGNTEINFCDGYKAQFQVPVKGPNSKGTIFFWARREDVSKAWDVFRLELELKDDKNRRLLIKKEAILSKPGET